MGKCGFSKFGGDSCGHGTSSADTRCVILSECKKHIRLHLRDFNVIDSSLKGEMQLIFTRAGIVPKYISPNVFVFGITLLVVSVD